MKFAMAVVLVFSLSIFPLFAEQIAYLVKGAGNYDDLYINNFGFSDPYPIAMNKDVLQICWISNGVLAILKNDNNGNDIFVINAHGDFVRKLTTSGCVDHIAVAPDGKSIIFAQITNDGIGICDNTFNLCKIDIDGSNYRLLAKFGPTNVAAMVATNSFVYVVENDGSREHYPKKPFPSRLIAYLLSSGERIITAVANHQDGQKLFDVQLLPDGRILAMITVYENYFVGGVKRIFPVFFSAVGKVLSFDKNDQIARLSRLGVVTPLDKRITVISREGHILSWVVDGDINSARNFSGYGLAVWR
ncbi:MAG: hypothetical protein NTW79_02860 [Candidatus Berkelbacteria bacterium]|nr:hypothetical protein [Candidatus Berkelbacteria bacterium]